MAEITAPMTKPRSGLGFVLFPKDAFFASPALKKPARFPIKAMLPWTISVYARTRQLTPDSAITKAQRSKNIILNARQHTVHATSHSRSLDFSGRGGIGKIENFTLVDGFPTNTPTAAHVFVFRLRDRKLVAQDYSSAVNGQYCIKGLNPGERYATVAFDLNGQFIPVADTNIRPTVD